MARTFETRIVAFVDILGFRDIVARMMKEPETFDTVRDALKTIDAQAEGFRRYRKETGTSRKELLRGRVVPLVQTTHLEMTAFSDCYVLSETVGTWRVLAAAQALGSILLRKGILSRGGIVQGGAYHRGAIAFGPAIIEAYELESQVAKYPRIVVSEEVRESHWGYHSGVCKSRLFLQDADGCWFLNVLAPPLSRWKALPNAPDTIESATFLTSVGAWLTKERHRVRKDIGKLSKLNWLAHHFNLAARLENGVHEIEETVAAKTK